ncbi:hypothetical protein PFISCL1PPCAC_14295, partial [Pristionchus fissidentatus]
PTFPAKCSSMKYGNEILLTCSLEFGNAVFPEFAAFTEKERWDIVSDFFYRFRSIEGCHRANLKFPDHPARFLANFTIYTSPEIFDDFFDGSGENAEKKAATEYIKNSKLRVADVMAGRAIIRKFDPRHEEFLAIIGLMFWSLREFR